MQTTFNSTAATGIEHNIAISKNKTKMLFSHRMLLTDGPKMFSCTIDQSQVVTYYF